MRVIEQRETSQAISLGTTIETRVSRLTQRKHPGLALWQTYIQYHGSESSGHGRSGGRGGWYLTPYIWYGEKAGLLITHAAGWVLRNQEGRRIERERESRSKWLHSPLAETTAVAPYMDCLPVLPVRQPARRLQC